MINTMILKEAGNFKIHKLCVIHLYEAEYNLLMAVKWRALVKLAEKNNMLNESQYGSRAGRSALDTVFIQEMEYEMTRMSRKPLVQLDFDAASCYDRIVNFLANIVSRARGMPMLICKVNGMTLQHVKYFLKTNLGISE